MTNGFGAAYEQPSYELSEDEIMQTLEGEDDWSERAEERRYSEPSLDDPELPRDRTFSARRLARAFNRSDDKIERLQARVEALAQRNRILINRLRAQVDESAQDGVMAALLNQVGQTTEDVLFAPDIDDTATDAEVAAAVRQAAQEPVSVQLAPTGINRIFPLIPFLSGRSGGTGGSNNMLPVVLALALNNNDPQQNNNDQNQNLGLILALTMMNR